jgi:hypothetical protein
VGLGKTARLTPSKGKNCVPPRVLDRQAEDEQRDIEWQEKGLADFKGHLNRPFEHEARLPELLVKQEQLNAALDLNKPEAQVVANEQQIASPASFAERVTADHARSIAV